MPNPWAGNGRTQRSICTALLPVDTFSAWENRIFFFFFLSFPFLFLLPYLLSNFHFPFLPLCPQRMFNSRGSFWASPAGPALAEGWRALCCPASLPWTRLWHLLPSTGPGWTWDSSQEWAQLAPAQAQSRERTLLPFLLSPKPPGPGRTPQAGPSQIPEGF